MNPPMPTGAAPGGAPPAAPAGEEDPFAMFRKQIAGLDGPGKKQALQAFEDSMFKIMQDNLSDVYAEVDGGDQQQPGAPPMTAQAKPPPAPAETSAPVIEDEYPIDPPDQGGGWTPEPVYTDSALYNEKAGEDIWEFIDDDSNGYGAFEEANGRADDPTTNAAYWGQPGVRDKFEKFREDRLKKHNLKRMPKSEMDEFGSPKQPGTYKPPFGAEGDAEGEKPDWTSDYPFSLEDSPEQEQAIQSWMDEKYGNADPATIQQAISDLSKEVAGYKRDGTFGGDASMMVNDVLERLKARAGKGSGRGRAMPPANDAEGMPPPRMTMMGRY